MFIWFSFGLSFQLRKKSRLMPELTRVHTHTRKTRPLVTCLMHSSLQNKLKDYVTDCDMWRWMFLIVCCSESGRQREEAGSPPFPFRCHVKGTAPWERTSSPVLLRLPLTPPSCFTHTHLHTHFHSRLISRANKWILICPKTFLFDIFQSSSQMWNIYVPFPLFIPVLEVQELQQGYGDTEINP